MIDRGAVDSPADVTRCAQLTARWRLYGWTGFLLLVALILNIWTARWSPRVWHDEIIFADPAVNLVQERGFTSSCWPCQRPGEVYVGNLPLYPVVLAGWIRVLGFGVVQVRSLNYVLVSLAVFLMVVGGVRRGMLKTVLACLLLSAGVLGGYWTSYSYRGGRYDMLGFALVAGCWAASTIRHVPVKLSALFVLGALVSLAGVPHAIGLMAIGGIAMLFSRFREWRSYVAASAGAIAGAAAYFLSLWFSGLLPVFRETLQRMIERSSEWEARISKLSHALAVDPSTHIVVAAAVLTAGYAVIGSIEHRPRVIRWMAAAVAFAFLVPTAFVIAGRFPEYYTWTKHVPALFCLIAGWEILRSHTQRGPRWISGVVVLAILISAAPMVLRLGYAFRARECRDYRKVDAAISPHLSPADQTFCSFAYYYPARRISRQVYVPVSVEWMQPDDWQQVTVAILDAADESLFFQHQRREDWRVVESFTPSGGQNDASGYAFRIYRRNESSAHSSSNSNGLLAMTIGRF